MTSCDVTNNIKLHVSGTDTNKIDVPASGKS